MKKRENSEKTELIEILAKLPKLIKGKAVLIELLELNMESTGVANQNADKFIAECLNNKLLIENSDGTYSNPRSMAIKFDTNSYKGSEIGTDGSMVNFGPNDKNNMDRNN